jgi:1-phosphatidylinositol-3-phosphate 5-kinase
MSQTSIAGSATTALPVAFVNGAILGLIPGDGDTEALEDIFQGIHNAESTSIGSKEGPVDLSMSQTSSSLSQNLSSSFRLRSHEAE